MTEGSVDIMCCFASGLADQIWACQAAPDALLKLRKCLSLMFTDSTYQRAGPLHFVGPSGTMFVTYAAMMHRSRAVAHRCASVGKRAAAPRTL
eukprot:8721572-Pyramimonas_sp.AAC.1